MEKVPSDGSMEVFKKLKIILGTEEEVTKQAQEFEKNHNVVNIKQYSVNTVFIFYLE